jgi:hypothetical protein
MNENEIVSEIRRIREQHAKEFGYDLDRIAADIRKGEEALRNDGWTLVTEPVKRRLPAMGPRPPR